MIRRQNNNKQWIETVFRHIEKEQFNEAAEMVKFFGNEEIKCEIASDAVSHGLMGYAFLDACSKIGF